MNSSIEKLINVLFENANEVILYFNNYSKYDQSVTFLKDFLLKEVSCLDSDLKEKVKIKEFSNEEQLKLQKIIDKYSDFFELISNEEDKQYKNERLFKAILQVPSEVRDFMNMEG